MAIATGQRPTAVILQDPYALHRHWWDHYWTPDPVRDTQWTTWDYALAKAYQVIQDMTSDSSGQPLWLAQSGRVFWDTESRIDGAAAAVQVAAEARDKLKPGEIIYATNPHVAPGEELPTMLDWLKDIEAGQLGRERGSEGAGVAPDLDAIEALREARKKKLEELNKNA